MSHNFTEFYRPWFDGTPVNAVKASTTIGSGDNGVVTIKSDLVGTEGNSFTITVSDAGTSGCAMSATINGKDITVVLGKTSSTLDPTKNTATLIATAINALDGVSATKSGTGADSIVTAVAKKNLAGGKYATPARTQGFIQIDGVWYIAVKPVDKWTTDGWYSATPTVI